MSVVLILNLFLTTLGILLVLFVPLFFLNRMIQRRLDRNEQANAGSEGKEVQDAGGFYRTRLWMRLIRLLYNIVRVALDLVLLFIVSPYVLQLFPSTASYAQQITAFLTGALSSAWSWFAEHGDELLTILIIILVTHGLTRLVRAFFDEVEQGTSRIAKFDPEWAPFTRRILNFLLIVGATMIAFPYVPGSDSDVLWKLDNNWLVLIAGTGDDLHLISKKRDVNYGIAGNVAINKKHIIAWDLTPDEEITIFNSASFLKTHSIIALPIMSTDQMVGVLELGSAIHCDFREDEADAFLFIAWQVKKLLATNFMQAEQ